MSLVCYLRTNFETPQNFVIPFYGWFLPPHRAERSAHVRSPQELRSQGPQRLPRGSRGRHLGRDARPLHRRPADSAVRESGDRVHAALKNLGFKWPDRRITINLAPADVRKTGPVCDLPRCWRYWPLPGQLEPPAKDTAFLGELALDGSLRPVSGVLPMALEAAAAVCGRSMSPPRMLPKPLKPAAARCRYTLPQRPVRSWMHCGASSHPAYDACPLRPCRCVEPRSRFR